MFGRVLKTFLDTRATPSRRCSCVFIVESQASASNLIKKKRLWHRCFPAEIFQNNFYVEHLHCVKIVRIRRFSGPYFPTLGLNTERYGVSLRIPVRMRENNDQKNSEYGYFSRSATGYYFWLLTFRRYSSTELFRCPHFLWFPSRHLLFQNQQWKHQNNFWNLFKINNKRTRMTSFWWLYCWLWTNFAHSCGVFIVDNEQFNLQLNTLRWFYNTY